MLRRINPFQPGEDRKAGGRYYKITPKILGSSGHPQLGGEYATLRIFRLLKAALADRVMTALDNGEGKSEALKGRLNEFNSRFKAKDANEKDCYRAAQLLESVNRSVSDAKPYTDALDDIDKIVPTRWRPDETVLIPQLLQGFYWLWDRTRKPSSSSATSPRTPISSPFTRLTLEQSKTILRNCGIDYEHTGTEPFEVQISVEQFERAVAPVIVEAVGIAKGVLDSHLPKGETLDWLILSGKTCNLDLVERLIRQAFLGDERFVWNPERITFDPEYAKMSTSIGACYAEKYRGYRFDPFGPATKELLRRGVNRLEFNVKNLFFFLPCKFQMQTAEQSAPIPIFEAGEKLLQLDGEPQPEAAPPPDQAPGSLPAASGWS